MANPTCESIVNFYYSAVNFLQTTGNAMHLCSVCKWAPRSPCLPNSLGEGASPDPTLPPPTAHSTGGLLHQLARKGRGGNLTGDKEGFWRSVGCLALPCRILHISLINGGIKVGSGGTTALQGICGIGAMTAGPAREGDAQHTPVIFSLGREHPSHWGVGKPPLHPRWGTGGRARWKPHNQD